jgi:hypothetical protein
LVASLNRPGGNVTGITIFGAATVTKRLQLLHELMPQTAAFAYLVNPNNPNHGIELRAAETAAHSLEMEMFVINAGSEREIDTAFIRSLKSCPLFSGRQNLQIQCPLRAPSGPLVLTNVRYWHLADMTTRAANVRLGVKRTLVGSGADWLGRE